MNPLQHARDQDINLSRVDLVYLDEVVEMLLLPPSRGARELEVETCVERLAGRVGTVPVRHDQSVVTPFLAQDALEQLWVLCHVDTVHLLGQL